MNMQSAQVNQMTVQLKDKIEQIQQFYSMDEEKLNMVLGPGYIKYSDLISSTDIEFWNYLCRKDFRRLQKLMSQNLGEGHFLDDTDSDDSDADGKKDGIKGL
jgi:hypothetical protein